MHAAIEATDLVKTYPGDVLALSGLGLTVEEGSIFGLVGPNGAGKSTTVKILTTLSRADSGQARVKGIDVLRHPDRVRRAIGVVAQKPGVDQDATGRENLILQGQLFGMRSGLRARADDLLERFGLWDAARRPVRTYSGGMQRRLDIATALVHRPKVLFMDEPTTGLDPEVRAEMWEEISGLAADEGLTILLTTHYLEEADRLAARLAIIDRGRVVAEGSPSELKGRLEGDALHLELAAATLDGEARSALMTLAEVRDVVAEGRSIHARVGDGARAIPAVLQTLDARGIVVSSVTISRPSLDDVYLGLTGRAFDEDRIGDVMVEVS